MDSSEELAKALAAGQSLEDYKRALENAVKKFTQNDLRQYVCYYDVICKSTIPLQAKKSLILALKNTGIPIISRWNAPYPLITALKNRDLPLLVFLVRKTSLKFTNNYLVLENCRNLGKNSDDNQFTINMLSKVAIPLTVQKKFLAGAIESGNLVLIKYIIEVLKPNLHIPTSQNRSTHSLAGAFAHSGNVDLLKYFENHGYNIHECQRELLNLCYGNRKNTANMIAYILNEQDKSSAADIYNEKVANKAFNEGDTETLEKFGKIGMVIYWNQVIKLLKEQREFIYFKVALDRFIERETATFVRYNRTWQKADNGNWRILSKYHVNQVWRIAKNRQDVWDYFKQVLKTCAESSVINYIDAKDGIEKNNPSTPVESVESDESENSSL